MRDMRAEGVTWSLLAGVVVFLLLFPAAGADSQPPIYYTVFGYEVPSGEPFLAAFTALGVVVVGLVATVVRARR